MFVPVGPETVDKQISSGIDRPPAVFAGHIFNEADRPLLSFQIEKLDGQSVLKLPLQPINFFMEQRMLGIDKTDGLRMFREVLFGHRDDVRFQIYPILMIFLYFI
jgi:hypothetical protein